MRIIISLALLFLVAQSNLLTADIRSQVVSMKGREQRPHYDEPPKEWTVEDFTLLLEMCDTKAQEYQEEMQNKEPDTSLPETDPEFEVVIEECPYHRFMEGCIGEVLCEGRRTDTESWGMEDYRNAFEECLSEVVSTVSRQDQDLGEGHDTLVQCLRGKMC